MAEPAAAPTEVRPTDPSTAGRASRSGNGRAASYWGHRPALDGLRVVAVYLVVAYHGGISVLPGGFVGVDLFFVLSGYLVTNMLLAEQATQGRVRLARFYARRMRRLLPASAVAILGTAAAFVLVAPAAERAAALSAGRSAFLYVANWYFLGQSADYFAAENAPSPFLHFWSLAIEEQFYVVFPLALVALIALARRAGRRPAVMAGGLAALCLLSLGSQLWSAQTDELRAYYATDARLYQILAGATLATVLRFWPAARRRWGGDAAAWAAVAGLCLVASSAWTPTVSVRGMAATCCSVVAIGALESRRSGSAAGCLSRPSMTYLGQISYGTYLWHWPVIVIVGRVVELSAPVATSLGVVIGTALAALSHQLVESPVRTGRRWDLAPRTVVAIGLAVSLTGALVALPAILSTDRPVAIAAGSPIEVDSTLDGAVPAGVDWEGARDDTPVEPLCLGGPPEDCIVVRGSGPHLHLVGDSHAKTVLPMMERLATERGYTFSATVTGACPWQRGLFYVDNEERTTRCAAMQPDWYDRVIPALDPDVVVLFHRAFDDPAFPRRMTSPEPNLDVLDQQDLVRTTSERTIADLRADGRRVVILEPLPVASSDPTSCLSGARHLSDCAFRSREGASATEDVYRRSAAGSVDVWALDLDGLTCPQLPVCLPMVDGLIVRRDAHHLTGTFARHLTPLFARKLDESGALSGL